MFIGTFIRYVFISETEQNREVNYKKYIQGRVSFDLIFELYTILDVLIARITKYQCKQVVPSYRPLCSFASRPAVPHQKLKWRSEGVK